MIGPVGIRMAAFPGFFAICQLTDCTRYMAPALSK